MPQETWHTNVKMDANVGSRDISMTFCDVFMFDIRHI